MINGETIDVWLGFVRYCPKKEQLTKANDSIYC